MKNFKLLLCTLLFLGCTAFNTVSQGAPVQKGDNHTLTILDQDEVYHFPVECSALPYSRLPELAVIELISVAPEVEYLPENSLVLNSLCEGYLPNVIKPPTNVFVLLRIYRPPSRHWC